MPSLNDSLAYWGAFLSTALACVKGWELWRDRSRVVVAYQFRGDEGAGNDILIQNLSKRPLLLSHWVLLYGSRTWPCRKYELAAISEHAEGDVQVAPDSTYILKFSGEQYFNWGAKALNGRGIYIRLDIAGRRSRVYRVYS